jgi:phosphoribosylformimino-5-aminoimidazole carboxamide ribotide isomerase
LVRHAFINETRDLQALTHGVELGRRAEIAQECGNNLGVTQVRDGVDEFVESRRRLGTRFGRHYLSAGHISMLLCYFAAMQIIPALDLLGDDAVRLEQGDYERVIFRQPLEEFMARIVATGPALIHVVDLEGARDGALRPAIIERCRRAAGSIPLQVSGGIRSIDAAERALDAGAARVIVGTSLWEREEALEEFAEALGDRLLAALDVRDGRLAVRGWRESSPLTFTDALARCQAAGVARLHVTAIDRDGTLRGPDLTLYREACASGLRVVAAGGVRDDADVGALELVGCEAAVMGLGYLARLGL